MKIQIRIDRYLLTVVHGPMGPINSVGNIIGCGLNNFFEKVS